MIRFVKIAYFNSVVVFVVIGAGLLSACLVASFGSMALGIFGFNGSLVRAVGLVFSFMVGLLVSATLLITIVIREDNGEEFRWIVRPTMRFLQSNSLGIAGCVISVILLIAGLIYGTLGR